MLDFLFTKTPLAFLTMPLWRDEAFSYLLAAKPFFLIPYLTSQDFSPPLYYLVLNMWMKFFGTSEIALRSLSLVFFVLTVYIVFDFITELLNVKGKRKWVYFALTAGNPFLMYYGFEARMYSMLAFFAAASWFSLLKHKWRWHILYTVAGLLTHYFMALVFVSQLVYSVIQSKTTAERKHIVKNVVSVGLLSLPWLIFVIVKRPPVQSQFWITRPTWQDIVTIPVMFLTGIENTVKGSENILYMGMAVLLWLYCALMAKRLFNNHNTKKLLIALLSWVFIPIGIVLALTVIRPLFLPRYLIFTSVGFMLLLFYFLENTREKARLLIIILTGFFMLYFHGYQMRHRTKADIRSTVREIKTLMNPGDVIYVDNELNFHPVQYYFDPQRVFIISKTHTEIPAYVGKILIPEDRMTLNAPVFPRRAFIISSDLTFEIQSVE